MPEVETTVASQKGQVVIPQSIRESLGIEPGTRFAVYGKGDTIVFKKVSLPTKEEFERLVDWGVAFAKTKRITRKDVLKDD